MHLPNQNEEMVRRLWFFYNILSLTKRIFESFYVTANISFYEITNVECLLWKLKERSGKKLSAIAKNMAGKYNKYWDNIEKDNSLFMLWIFLTLDKN
jgi:Domain of unknown function (DUF4413)